ncbi:MAG: BamA/TamA family outer membrane protein [Ferruginibacter sp.]|nr:BamA/TamA family outer membrane protein [Chitinophagaceae bacterium]
MRKCRLQISVLTFLLLSITTRAQQLPGRPAANYPLHLRGVDKDSATIVSKTGMQTVFASRADCENYINKLPGYLQAKGYVTVSIDSLHFDSAFARIVLFTGELYLWALLDAKNVEPALLDATGWREKIFAGKPIDFNQVQVWEDRLLNHLENNGYPFARIYLDSLQLDNDRVSALLRVNKGPLYKIDSIRLYGNAKISNSYLQRYLDIPNGSIYNKEKLLRINKKIRELAYVEEEKPADLTRLGTGSVLNMYLKQKKSSQVNILIGFLPNNNQLASKKLLITGEGNMLLKNALGSGETIGLNFQALQVESQRLNFLYQHPYLFNSPLGLDFLFDIFRKDSSFVNINLQLGAQYILNNNQSGKLFAQKTQTIISEGGVNSPLVIQTRRLPDVADVNSFNVGVEYEFNNTDYRLNPKKGNEFRIITSIGTKKIKKNNEIAGLKDPTDPSFDFEKLYDTVKLKTYQLRVSLAAAKYFPLRNQRSTIKTAINAGMFQSGNIFRNELFQLGGYKILRGFDEESQYVSQFAIATLEYRYLVGQNSFFYALADGGWGQDNSQQKKLNYTWFGTGLGLVFQTKAGIFNIALAVGKRNDTQFNLRQSKIHFGFVNYF